MVKIRTDRHSAAVRWLRSISRVVGQVLSPGGRHGRLTILAFHKILRDSNPLSPGELNRAQFESIIDAVAAVGDVIPLQDAVRHVRQGTLPKRAVVLTFDDGYLEWLDTACPALHDRGLPATFFLSTDHTNGRAHWHERIAAAVHALPPKQLQLPVGGASVADLGSLPQRLKVIAELQESLKYLPINEREQSMLALEKMTPTAEHCHDILSPDAVREIAAMGFEVGAHTHTHPILTQCTAEQAWQEIAQSKAILEDILGKSVLAFAYPNGRPSQDFSPIHVDMVKRAGYSCAVTTAPGAARTGDDIYQLPRVTPWTTNEPRLLRQLAANLSHRAVTTKVLF